MNREVDFDYLRACGLSEEQIKVIEEAFACEDANSGQTGEDAIKKLKDILEEATETDKSVCYVTSDDALVDGRVHDYCEKCGARMVEPQESEEKPKSECEHDHEILKAYSDGANAVLDNVRAEIESKYESIPETFHHYETGFTDALEWVLSIIDKYQAESEEKEK